MLKCNIFQNGALQRVNISLNVQLFVQLLYVYPQIRCNSSTPHTLNILAVIHTINGNLFVSAW